MTEERLPTIEIGVGVDLGVTKFSLNCHADAHEVNVMLDLMTKAIGRQQTKQSLAERIMDLREAKLWLQSWPQPRHAFGLQRAVERQAQVKEFERQHEAAGKRMDWKPTVAQKNWLEAFDQQTQQKFHELDELRQKKEKLIPNLEAQIERLREIVNGRDPIEETETDTAKIGIANVAD